jgi:hypothetical protein
VASLAGFERAALLFEPAFELGACHLPEDTTHLLLLEAPAHHQPACALSCLAAPKARQNTVNRPASASQEATVKAKALALRVIAEEIEHGEGATSGQVMS